MHIQLSNHDVDQAQSPPPDWGLVPFEVSCARCGQNLRGLTDPTCPACEFQFEWSDAVPIEHLTCEQCGYKLMGLTDCRCPECGTAFTWDHAIAAYHQSRQALFEYRWRDRPVRSFVHTVRLMFRPKSLWQQLSIHDRPQARPLVLMIAPLILAIPLALLLLESVNSWAWELRFMAEYGMPAGAPGVISFSHHLAQSLTMTHVYTPALHLILWVLLTCATLLMLRQSMKRYRILSRQVFRVWAYCVPIPAAAALLVFTATSHAMLLTRFRPGEIVYAAFSLTIAVYQVYLLREGYRQYLKMPHAWGVAIAAHLIGFIGAGVLMAPLQALLAPI